MSRLSLHRWWRWLLPLAVVLGGATLGWKRYALARSKAQAPKAPPALAVTTVSASRGDIAVNLDALGTVTPLATVTVKARVEGQLESAKVQLVYCRITSPIAGRVGLRLVDPGNIVQTTDTTGLLVITQLQPITVVFSVAEDFLPQIQRQNRAGRRLEVDAFDRARQKRIATGEVLTFDNQIDTTTGTVKVKAIFPNDDEALFPNQFVNARVQLD